MSTNGICSIGLAYAALLFQVANNCLDTDQTLHTISKSTGQFCLHYGNTIVCAKTIVSTQLQYNCHLGGPRLK